MTHTAASPSLIRRFACLAYESLLMAAILLLVSAFYTPLKAWAGQSFWLEQAFRAVLAGALFAYFGTSWVTRGQTVAMKAWRIQVETTDGRRLDWPHAAMRYLISLAVFVLVPVLAYVGTRDSYGHRPVVALAAFSWCILPFLCTLIDPDKRALHDRLAGTRMTLVAKTLKTRP